MICDNRKVVIHDVCLETLHSPQYHSSIVYLSATDRSIDQRSLHSLPQLFPPTNQACFFLASFPSFPLVIQGAHYTSRACAQDWSCAEGGLVGEALDVEVWANFARLLLVKVPSSAVCLVLWWTMCRKRGAGFPQVFGKNSLDKCAILSRRNWVMIRMETSVAMRMTRMTVIEIPNNHYSKVPSNLWTEGKAGR